MLRSGGSYRKDENSLENGFDCLSDHEDHLSKTVQSERDNADINVIVKRFKVTGQLPQGVRVPSYGDYTTVSDFRTAMNMVREAEENFMELPSQVRFKFGNDPQAFLEFCQDPANVPEMVKMGLAVEVKQADNTPAVSGSPDKGDNDEPAERAVKRDEKAGRSAEGSRGKRGES